MSNPFHSPGTFIPENILQKLDPRVKLIFFLLLSLVVLITSISNEWKFLAIFLFLFFLLILSQIPVKIILSRFLLLVPLIIFLALILFLFGHEPLSKKTTIIFDIAVKSGLLVFIFSLLFVTTGFYPILKGLEQLKCPKILISVLSFAYQYIFLFSREGERFKQAWTSRSTGKNRQWKSITILLSAIPHFFSRVLDRSIKIYAAMLSRGFDRNIPFHHSYTLKKTDYLFMMGFTIFLIGMVIS